MEKIGITEAIQVLRSELNAAILASASEEIRFEVGEITVEFEVAAERVAGVNGGVKFWVVEVGAQGSRSTTRSHRLSIPLTPVRIDGSAVLTGDNSLPH